MNEIGRMARSGRAELFEETAAQIGINSMVVEKDFWVCWTLQQMERFFVEDESGEAALTFKGGTSLSKAFGLIRRFSEDLDLTISRSMLDVDGVELLVDDSLGKNKRKAILSNLDTAAAGYVMTEIRPALVEALRDCGVPEASTDEEVEERFFTAEGDDGTLIFQYPAALNDTNYPADAYIRPEIRLELGAKGDTWPSRRAIVRPFVADAFESILDRPTAEVLALDPTRTFWEKATILHVISHKGPTAVRDRISRHYYDLAVLNESPFGALATADTSLLAAVAQHKQRFFSDTKARYDLAKPGTLCLMPSEHIEEALRRDYRAMSEMFFDEPRPLAEILEVIRVLETLVNGNPRGET